MKACRAPHRWAVTAREAIVIQRRLAARVREEKPPRRIRLVAGLDAAFSPDETQCIAAAVLYDVQSGAVLEQRTAVRPVRFPYIPGLLSFREGPAVLAALRRLRQEPDALMADGHGLAHPRRLGIASHLGVITGRPSIGCAKSRLVGEHREPGARRGARAPLHYRGAVVGTVLRTRDGVKPVFVSVGHGIDLATAEQVVLDCAVGYRLPEPTRLADHLVARARRAMI